MRWSIALIALAALGQYTGPDRGSPMGQPVGNIYEQYGRPYRTSLEDIVMRPSFYSKPPRNVRVEGIVDLGRGEHFRLVDRSSKVILIQAYNFDGARMMMGRSVEVVGVVRELKDRYETFTCGATTSGGQQLCQECPEPMCDDPDLPNLPESELAGPRVSITVWSISGAGDFGGNETESEDTGTTILDIVDAPGNWIDQSVTVTGQFCGRGLCGPVSSASIKNSDWQIRRDDASIWVTGKKPKGKGWQLNPGDDGDTKWWLRVTGKIVVVGDAVAIKAKKLKLIRAPRE